MLLNEEAHMGDANI